MRKNRGKEPIWVIIHIYMEISQGNSLCSLCSYLYLKQGKMSFFLLFPFFHFSSTKSEDRGQNRSCRGAVSVPVLGDVAGKGCRRVNTVQILCAHICKWKNTC
jgi:hypothetical protein